MDNTINTPKAILARQPIFDRHFRTYAYELLFRKAAGDDSADIISGDLATTQVINHTFLEIGVDNVIGNHLAFVNLTRNFILSDNPMPFTQNQVVLEILEDIETDDELIAGVKKLINLGYTIALDDFIFKETLRPLIKLAKIIKVDLLSLNRQELIEHVDILKKYDVKLLAEKVETREDYDLCMKLGFDYFQGYFFCRPEIIEGSVIPVNKMNLLRLLEKVQEPNIELKELETLISQDANLSYKLLRLLNSAAVGLPRRVESIHESVIYLGIKAIQTWTTIILSSEMSSNNSRELVENALIRAKMCEKIAHYYNQVDETGFLVGLLSVLDVILSTEMSKLVTSLPLTNDAKQALTTHEGELGSLLENVINYEQANWQAVDENIITTEELSEIYLDAVKWMMLIKSTN